MSIFFDRTYNIEGTSVPVQLGFKDVIFVMEDVDAASNVVKRRDGHKTADVVETETLDLPVPKSMWRMLLETSDSDCKELVEKLMEKSERLKKEAQKPEVLRAIAQRMMILPALGLVGEGSSSDDPTLSKLSQEAVESASNLMSNYSTVDSFVSGHARAIKSLLETGAEIDEAFVDELLGKNQPNFGQSAITVPKSNYLSRDVSYTKYGDSSKMHLENKAKKEEAALSSTVNFQGAASSTEIGTSTFVGPYVLSKPNKDQLTLSGLLNVLDGVVDTPGRILIMTSNHPEMLDPALIRPGRIDKNIMLGYMASTDVICMLEHYFQTSLGNRDVSRVETIINGAPDGTTRCRLNLTPAQVEQLSAEHDDLQDMIDALEEMGHSCAPRKKYGMIHDSAIAYGV